MRCSFLVAGLLVALLGCSTGPTQPAENRNQLGMLDPVSVVFDGYSGSQTTITGRCNDVLLYQFSRQSLPDTCAFPNGSKISIIGTTAITPIHDFAILDTVASPGLRIIIP
jgi:hypothetical protein